MRSTRIGRLLGNRALLLLLGAALVSQVGDWILATGVAFEVYALSGSTVVAAAVLLATRLPQVLLSSGAGSLVDRWDRRRTLIAADVVLAVLLAPLLLVERVDQVWIVVGVVALSSCVLPFQLSAEASLLPALVDPDDLITANAMNGQVRNVARLVGAALGGLAATGGFALVAGADVATFGLAVALLVALRPRVVVEPQAEAAGPRRWTAGLAVVRSSRPLAALLAFFALAGAGEGVMGTLFAPFVRDVLGGTGATYGAILAAQAVGGIVGGVVVAATGHRVAPRLLLGGGALAFGALDLVLFLAPLAVPSPWVAAVVIALVGLPSAALSAGMMTVFQVGTTTADRGAVFGALLTAQNATMLGGTVLAGLLAASLGVLPVIVLQALAYLLGGAIVLLATRTAPRAT